jgi:hypothetical protein
VNDSQAIAQTGQGEDLRFIVVSAQRLESVARIKTISLSLWGRRHWEAFFKPDDAIQHTVTNGALWSRPTAISLLLATVR